MPLLLTNLIHSEFVRNVNENLVFVSTICRESVRNRTNNFFDFFFFTDTQVQQPQDDWHETEQQPIESKR